MPRKLAADLVLRRPQHYHVEVLAYESAADNGDFQWSGSYTLTDRSVEAAVERAKRLSGRGKAHVRTVNQCPDPKHLVGI